MAGPGRRARPRPAWTEQAGGQALQPFQRDRGPVYLLHAVRGGDRLQVAAARVDGLALRSPNFAYSGAPGHDQVAELVAADDAAERVGRLDVQVERDAEAARISASSASVTSDGMLTVAPPRSARSSKRDRVGRGHRRGDLPHDPGGQVAARLGGGDRAEQPEVGDQEATGCPARPRAARPRARRAAVGGRGPGRRAGAVRDRGGRRGPYRSRGPTNRHTSTPAS